MTESRSISVVVSAMASAKYQVQAVVKRAVVRVRWNREGWTDGGEQGRLDALAWAFLGEKSPVEKGGLGRCWVRRCRRWLCCQPAEKREKLGRDGRGGR